MNGEFQQQFAYRVRRVLNRGVDSLDPRLATRLFESRQKALASQRVSVAGLSLAGVGQMFPESFASHARMALATFALLLGVTLTYCWNMYDQAAGYAEIDSALLADEVPFDAYLDQGFHEWLDHLAQEDSSPQ
jgi:hypothetical protein